MKTKQVYLTPEQQERFVKKINHMKQTDIAARVGVSTSHISRIMSLDVIPGKTLFHSMIREFGINEKWVMTGEEEAEKTSVFDDQPPELLTVFAAAKKKWETLPPSGRFILSGKLMLVIEEMEG